MSAWFSTLIPFSLYVRLVVKLTCNCRSRHQIIRNGVALSLSCYTRERIYWNYTHLGQTHNAGAKPQFSKIPVWSRIWKLYFPQRPRVDRAGFRHGACATADRLCFCHCCLVGPFYVHRLFNVWFVFALWLPGCCFFFFFWLDGFSKRACTDMRQILSLCRWSRCSDGFAASCLFRAPIVSP